MWERAHPLPQKQMLSGKLFVVLPVLSGPKLDYPDLMSGCAISGNQLLQSHSSLSRRFAIAYWSLVRWTLLSFVELSRSVQSDRLDICMCLRVCLCAVWGIETAGQCGKLSFVHDCQGSRPSLAPFLPLFEGDASFAKFWRNRHTCLEDFVHRCLGMVRCCRRPCADAIPTCARFETEEDSWVIRDATNLRSTWWRWCWSCRQRLWRWQGWGWGLENCTKVLSSKGLVTEVSLKSN